MGGSVGQLLCRSSSWWVSQLVSGSASQLMGRSVSYECVSRLVIRSVSWWVGPSVGGFICWLRIGHSVGGSVIQLAGSVSQLMGRSVCWWVDQLVTDQLFSQLVGRLVSG